MPQEPQSISPAALQTLAERQLADYDARQPGTVFGEGVSMDVAQGYAVQTAVTQLRCARGERVIGYKVGCTSPTIRDQLGIDHSVTGRLFNTEHHASGSELSRHQFAHLAIEGELAVELLREPTASDFATEGIPPCVARVFPVIELHHHVLRSTQPSAGELIANNAIHAGFVAGEGRRIGDLSLRIPWESWSLSISVDGQLHSHCTGSLLVQTIHESLKWLCDVLRQRGDRLEQGSTVLTGSIPPLIPATECREVRVDTHPLGSVEARFIP